MHPSAVFTASGTVEYRDASNGGFASALQGAIRTRSPKPEFTGREGAAEGGTMRFRFRFRLVNHSPAGAPRCRSPSVSGAPREPLGVRSPSGAPRCPEPLGSPSVSEPLGVSSLSGSPSEAPRCQFIFSGAPRGAPRCQFIFSGKNDELTPDFRERMMNCRVGEGATGGLDRASGFPFPLENSVRWVFPSTASNGPSMATFDDVPRLKCRPHPPHDSV